MALSVGSERATPPARERSRLRARRRRPLTCSRRRKAKTMNWNRKPARAPPRTWPNSWATMPSDAAKMARSPAGKAEMDFTSGPMRGWAKMKTVRQETPPMRPPMRPASSWEGRFWGGGRGSARGVEGGVDIGS